MASAPMGNVLRQFSRLFASGTTGGMTEALLLERFLGTRDEAAFAALVERFGPMVLGVCRKFLPDPHAAEDAFQATFLVLVRRAGTIRDRDLVGHWLYAVALKVVKRSRADLARRRLRERGGEDVDAYPVADAPPSWPFDVGPILQEELARLPENYRKPLVLCFLDGRSHEDAARQLQWPVGTVKGRISRGKEMLRERLTRRGVAITTAAIAASLSQTASATVSPILIDSTVRAAMGIAAGGAVAAGACSATAAALSEGVVASMMLAKFKVLAGGLVALGTVVTGAAVMARQLGPANPPNPGATAAQAPAPPQKQAATAPGAEKKAQQDNPRMAESARASRLNQLRVDVARRRLAREQQSYEKGAQSLDGVFKASRELMLAFRNIGWHPAFLLHPRRRSPGRTRQEGRGRRASKGVAGRGPARDGGRGRDPRPGGRIMARPGQEGRADGRRDGWGGAGWAALPWVACAAARRRFPTRWSPSRKTRTATS